MDKKIMSPLDAFIALDEFEDEEVTESVKKLTENLTEGKFFDVRSSKEMEDAKVFNEEKIEDIDLEVIDADADTVEHLKDKKEYVGQFILECNVCKKPKFIDGDKLVVSEDDDKKFNVEDECPHCHSVGEGYSIKGQVGKVEEPEASIENDHGKEDEAKFDNDEPQDDTETPEVKEGSWSDGEEKVEEPADELDYDETPEADDTADMEDTSWNEIDPDDVAFDPTEEMEEPLEPEEDGEKKEEKEEPEVSHRIEDDEEDKKKKNESLVEEVQMEDVTVAEFFEDIVEPDNIESVAVIDLDDDGRTIYDGPSDEIPHGVFEAKFCGFTVGTGALVVNIDSDEDAHDAAGFVKDLESELAYFIDESNTNISVWDQAIGDEVISGTKMECIEAVGDKAFLSFDAPTRIELHVRNLEIEDSLRAPIDKTKTATEELVEQIIESNHMGLYNIKRPSCDEYWINESIMNEEDLDIIYNKFVKPTLDEDLINHFKNVTHYKDELDIVLENMKSTSTEKITEEENTDKFEETRAEALQQLKDSGVSAIIFGYDKNNVFHRLNQFVLCHNTRELQDGTKIIKLEHRPIGNVHVVYQKGPYGSTFESYKTRKELGEAILALENNKRPYVVKKSIKEGYMYDLIFEDLINEEEGITPVQAVTQTEPVESDAPVDPRDLEIVSKLDRIASDICESIERAYGVTCDKRLILADLIQDLQLVTGNLKPEELVKTPLNELTAKMYDAYKGFWDSLDNFVSAITGEQISTSEAERTRTALASLDGANFTKETIDSGIRSPEFLASLQHAQVPGIDYHGMEPETVALIPEVQPSEEESGEVTEALESGAVVEGLESGDMSEGLESGSLIHEEHICTKCGKPLSECTCCEASKFEKFINEYFDDNYEDTIIFEEVNRRIEGDMIVVEGLLSHEDKETLVTFNLKESKQMNESTNVEESFYTVTNNLSEETLKYYGE